MSLILDEVDSKMKTINGVMKRNPHLEMEGIQLRPVLLLSVGTIPILKYSSTWCDYNVIPILLNGPDLVLYKIL